MALELPSFVARGERARLFPVLADTSKEGRTLSIVLACFENVDEFGRALLSTVGPRIGVRSKVETYTEVVLKKTEKKHRPDGLIVVRNGSSQWTALIEAKVGTSELTQEQIEAYLEIAKQNSVDAVITLSNQFAALPTHHPIPISGPARRKAALFHWSWMYVMTQASLLLSNDEVSDHKQRVILNELLRFLGHPSAGVRSFDQMPPAWSNLVSTVQAGGSIVPNSSDSLEAIGAWHQEVRDLSLILSRQLAIEVDIRISRLHAADPVSRVKADAAKLAAEKAVSTTLLVPGAAAPLDICADLQTRTVAVSMRLKAPNDRQSTKARLNWLLRQLQKGEDGGLYVRLNWPGRSAMTQYPLTELRQSAERAVADRAGLVVTSFEVVLVRDLGAKFGQRRNFIAEIENAVPEFYEKAGQHLKAWQASAPRLRDEKAEPESVTADAMWTEAEEVAISRDE